MEKLLDDYEERFTAQVLWHPAGEEDSRTPYIYDHTVQFGDRAAILSASKSNHMGSPNAIAPEEFFISSIASCQMLTYLSLCRRNQIEVVSYHDDAVGVIVRNGDGRRHFEVIRLSPKITIKKNDEENIKMLAIRLIHEAHYDCHIINSVSSRVDVEPIIIIED